MQNPELCLYASIIFFSIGGIFFISICCLCSRIKLAIAVIKVSPYTHARTPAPIAWSFTSAAGFEQHRASVAFFFTCCRLS